MIQVSYRVDCSMTVMISGVTVQTSSAPGPVFPPGPYDIQVTTQLPDAMFDPASCTAAQFSISGPGVSWSTVLQYGGLYTDHTSVVLAPSSVYTAVDANHPAQTTWVFSTAATGSSSSLLVAPTSTLPSVGQTQQSLIGSGVAPYRGALHATVAPSGKAVLESSGKNVAVVEAGRYDIVARDDSKHGGFFVQKASSSKPETITTVAFTGSKTVRVDLTAGKWTFFSKSGAATQFVVD